MDTRKKVALSTAGLTAFALVGLLLALPAVPVRLSGSTSLPMASAFVPLDGRPAAAAASSPDLCAQVFAVFPQNGTTLIDYNYSSGSQGFRLYNLSLSTAFQSWYTFNNGTSYQSGSQWKVHNETTTYAVSGNLDSLLASNDQLSLKGGSFLFTVNGSRDSQVTATNSAATVLQYNATTVSVSLVVHSLQATIGPLMARALNVPAMSFSVSNAELTLMLDCQTGKTSYSFSGSMTGAGARLAAAQLSSLDVGGAGL